MADELETLLKLYGRKAGVYVLHNGIKIRVWYEGKLLKTLELGDPSDAPTMQEIVNSEEQ